MLKIIKKKYDFTWHFILNDYNYTILEFTSQDFEIRMSGIARCLPRLTSWSDSPEPLENGNPKTKIRIPLMPRGNIKDDNFDTDEESQK